MESQVNSDVQQYQYQQILQKGMAEITVKKLYSFYISREAPYTKQKLFWNFRSGSDISNTSEQTFLMNTLNECIRMLNGLIRHFQSKL